ncbi:MAG: hypothetical protein HY717_05295 [Planctomycetes bacterium]|nr:hypothetical protein [Planctomycetota bacterium]
MILSAPSPASGRPPPPAPAVLRALFLAGLGMPFCGCSSFLSFQHFETIDRQLVWAAQRSVSAPPRPALDQRRRRDRQEEEAEPAPQKSVVLGVLLAFFPGIIVPGVGHYYAGDTKTAKRLFEMGEWGYLFAAIGGGVGTGAYFLDKSQDNFLPIGLYVAAGGMGTVGAAFLLTAWICDMVDTPRAIRTGGEPWNFFKDDEDFLTD